MLAGPMMTLKKLTTHTLKDFGAIKHVAVKGGHFD